MSDEKPDPLLCWCRYNPEPCADCQMKEAAAFVERQGATGAPPIKTLTDYARELRRRAEHKKADHMEEAAAFVERQMREAAGEIDALLPRIHNRLGAAKEPMGPTEIRGHLRVIAEKLRK